jgi:membrane fusion protein
MSEGSASLFRAEVLRHRADRLHGNVILATPIAWQAIGFLLLAAIVIVIGFLATASYARIETAAGVVTLDKGVATIMPSRAGIIASIAVSEGQQVHAGDVLARIRSEEDMIGGNTASSRIRDSLNEQDQRLISQGKLLLTAVRAEQDRLREQITGISGELTSLARQIDDQHRLVEVALADYNGARRIAENGFISRRDLEARQTTVLSRQQQLAQLEQLRASKTAAIAESRRAITQSGASAQAQIASGQSDRAALTQQLAQADLARGYLITSPVDGIVTALTARLGQAATSQQQLMIVVPAGAAQRVELYVPTAAAGFVHHGQEVRVAIDAFPYQTFGTLSAHVADVSTTTIARQGPNGPIPVYLVTAELPQPSIKAFGQNRPLAPGMTLTARIVTENRSLLEWLFQPIFAVRNR